MRGNRINLTILARELRKNMTAAERTLWSHLRNRQFQKLKFRRQVQIGPFIADFYCHELRLIIEVDGGQHTPPKDRSRTEWLENEGHRMIRFLNNDVLKNLDGVFESLAQQITPSSSRR